MLITNNNTLKQALANIRLESLTLPESVAALLEKAMNEPNSGVTTDQVLIGRILRKLWVDCMPQI